MLKWVICFNKEGIGKKMKKSLVKIGKKGNMG
jgi:hypothetical protein